jgi:non-specific serine/threonine protein kinase/serine/threonine-protein kinase
MPFREPSENDSRYTGVRAVSLDISALSSDLAADSQPPAIWQATIFIGPYRLIEQIGSGGMGEVWLAEQTKPVRRHVALKLIKAGMDTDEVVGRFRSEQQALALMDHPSIAKVFDAGATPQGRPYFVMEYITGVPITKYCDQHRMGVRERLELFIRVCEGVQHAHQKAIIHRDLKPSNILVSEVDGNPEPRIIDFGVAKAISHGLIAETEFTRAGVILGTPAYISPEQAGSSGMDVDTRTDVYSLGVILYELLVGERPFDFHNVGFEEILRRLKEDESPRPSAKISRLDDQSTAAAYNRCSDPPTLTRHLRGDLDAITLKALEKDRTRRYGSPSELAADIRRYLNHEAVLAVAPSTAYRAGKFARRYRRALGLIGACVLVLVLATAVATWQGIKATKQRQRADAETAAEQAVNDFLRNDLLGQASAANQAGPHTRPDPDIKVRTVLDRAASRIATRFKAQPQVEAAIRSTIGQAYMDLGLYPNAQSQFERALELNRKVLGANNPRTLKSMGSVGWVLFLEGKYPQAEAILRQTLDIRRGILGREDPDTLLSMSNLASDYQAEGKYTQAEALHKQTIELRRRVLGPEHRDTLASMNNLADVYAEQGKYAQAEALDRQTLNIKQRVLGSEHPDTLISMNNLAVDYQSQGKYAQAQALLTHTLQIERRVLGSKHPGTLRTMSNLAVIYYLQGDYNQAEPLYTQNLEITRQVLGPQHPDTLGSMNNLADVYAAQDKYAQAEAVDRRALEIQRRVLGAEHPDTLGTLSSLASIYQRQGNYASAEAYATQALAGRRHALGSGNSDTMTSAVDLATAYLAQGKFPQSESLSREALEFDQRNAADDWQRFRAESVLGASLAAQKKYGEAEPLLLESYQGMLARKERIAVPDRYHLDRAREWIVQLYRAWRKPEKAAGWSGRAGKR